jgi:hypothetical protein
VAAELCKVRRPAAQRRSANPRTSLRSVFLPVSKKQRQDEMPSSMAFTIVARVALPWALPFGRLLVCLP